MQPASPLQPDLFEPKRRRHDEALLLRRLREAVTPPPVPGMSRAAIRRAMTPLPRITALD